MLTMLHFSLMSTTIKPRLLFSCFACMRSEDRITKFYSLVKAQAYAGLHAYATVAAVIAAVTAADYNDARRRKMKIGIVTIISSSSYS